MQTAITIPDRLFTQADQLAIRLGVTRNELYLRAVAALSEDSVTEQLDQVYATEESTVDPVLWKLQMLSLPQDEW
jgi:transcriptional regulator